LQARRIRLRRPLELAALGPRLRGLVGQARALAREKRVPLFLVGGAVRDLLLGRKVSDVDLVVEGDAAAFANALAARCSGQARLHGRFGTAAVVLLDGTAVDVAAARRESYAAPGALPRVAPAGIQEDLRRRDFTVNAMALELAPSPHPRLLDPEGGRADLARGRLAILHARSAFDDPTRAFRAVRYANRLGFRIAPGTRRAIAAALAGGAFEAVSGDRLRRELERIFAEPGRAAAVRLLVRLGLDAALGAKLPADAAALARLRRAERIAGEWREAQGWLSYLLVWAAGSTPRRLSRLADRLAIAGSAGERLRAWAATRRRIPRLAAARLPSARRRILEGLSPAEVLAVAAELPAAKVADVLAAARGRTLLRIQGRDLVEAGVAPGPAVGRALEAARAAREDGLIAESEELAFALRRAAARSRGR